MAGESVQEKIARLTAEQAADAAFRRAPCPNCGPSSARTVGNYPCRCLTRHWTVHCWDCGTIRYRPELGDRCGEVSMGSADGGLTR